MKIRDLFKESGNRMSFEVFPPKTSDKYESVQAAAESIAALSPFFMSVTYGAGGGTSKYTIDIAKDIERSYKVPCLAHLTCVSSTKETVKERIADIKAAGIENIMSFSVGGTPSCTARW